MELQSHPPSDHHILQSNDDKSHSSEILEEVLELVRSQQRLLRSPEELLPPGYLEHILRRTGSLPFNLDAIRDLEKAWLDIRDLLEFHGTEDMVPKSVLDAHLSRLSEPLDYILRRGYLSGRRTRSIHRPTSTLEEAEST